MSEIELRKEPQNLLKKKIDIMNNTKYVHGHWHLTFPVSVIGFRLIGVNPTTIER